MIETTITKIQYDADGVQRRWSIPFPYADVKHISIYTKVGEEPTVKVVDNYDIDEDDAVVIYPTVASGQEPLASGTKITIARETPETQLEDASQVHFTSKDVERGLDKLTMITQELSTTSGEMMEVSAAAFEAAEDAVNSAALANKTAEEAKTIAGQAVGIATDAKSIAEGIDAKATQALANSNTALEKATEAKNTADSYQEQITTLRNDVDDLGDQVATIEGKIPAEATTANQLADKEFVTTITDELAADITALNADIQQINLIKWVQALPTTGETKYLYAIPRNEVDKDGKKIVALYLWDGTEWRGAGGTSIDPGTSEGDGIKGDYCTTYGIIDAPNGILTNPSGMEVVLKQGVVLQLAGQDIKTTISGNLTHTITSTADCDLFYVSGTTSLMEVAQIVWSRIEPDNGQTGVLAWWNPNNKKWKFKSNDTGNVWAEAVATPVAHIHTNGTTITRIDHIGYRILDDEVYALKSETNMALTGKANIDLGNTNMLTNCILSAPNGVMQVSSTDPYTLIVNKGLKVALANGYNADGTPKSEIVTLENDVFLTRDPGESTFILFIFLCKLANGSYKILTPATFDFGAVSAIPSNITGYKVYHNITDNKLYEYGSDFFNTYDKFVMLGSVQLTNGQFTQVFPYKPIQLSLEGLGDYVVESQVNVDGSWYRKYKSGWLEQGGQTAGIAGSTPTTVTLLKPYNNTAYNVIVQPVGAYTKSGEANNVIPTRTTTNFILTSGQIATQPFIWRAEGQGA